MSLKYHHINEEALRTNHTFVNE